MPKRPFEMTSAEWCRAYEAARSGNVQERFTRAATSQMVGEFRARETLRFGARMSVSRRLASATRGEVKISQQRANRLLSILRNPVTHRDVVVTALKQGLMVPPEVLAEYPGLELRRYSAARNSGQ